VPDPVSLARFECGCLPTVPSTGAPARPLFPTALAQKDGPRKRAAYNPPPVRRDALECVRLMPDAWLPPETGDAADARGASADAVRRSTTTSRCRRDLEDRGRSQGSFFAHDACAAWVAGRSQLRSCAHIMPEPSLREQGTGHSAYAFVIADSLFFNSTTRRPRYSLLRTGLASDGPTLLFGEMRCLSTTSDCSTPSVSGGESRPCQSPARRVRRSGGRTGRGMQVFHTGGKRRRPGPARHAI
jgi:hypothetical protein